MTPAQAAQLQAIYDALFKTTPVTIGGKTIPGGALLTLAYVWELIQDADGAPGSFTSADRAMLDDIPNKGELGQALTGTVNLVNQTAATNRDAIIAQCHN